MYIAMRISMFTRSAAVCVLFLATTLILNAQFLPSLSQAGPGYDDEKMNEPNIVNQIIRSEWLGISWTPVLRYDNEYDHHARLWSQTAYVWTVGDWQLFSRQLFSWDNAGEMISSTTQTWTGSAWKNVLHERESCNISLGERTRTRFEWKGGDWDLVSRSVSRCNETGQVETVQDYEWCEDGWRACVLTQMLYNSVGLYVGYEKLEIRDNFLFARSTAETDPGGRIGWEVHYTRQRGGEWGCDYRERWMRDDCGVLVDLYTDLWQDGSWRDWKWDSYISEPFSLDAPADPDVHTFTMSIFPNPSSGVLQVKVDCPRSILARLECYDMLGRRLAEFPARQFPTGATLLPLQLQNLPRGVVFLRLVDGVRVFNTRSLILR